MTIKWTVSPNVITKNIRVYGETTMKNIHKVADEIAVDGKAHMKNAAPWTDRTGDARRTLSTDVEKSPKQTVINFRHGVEYGIWLEVKNGGRYAIVRPAVMQFADETMRRLRGAGG